MVSTIKQIIDDKNPQTILETKSIIREIIQSIVLIGLSRSGFFKKGAFYGGTALRIFYGLNRYSEDLDFTLFDTNKDFSLDPYINKIKEVGLSYGLEFEVTTKIKKIETPIESAFAKLNTYQTFINLKIDNKLTDLLHKDESIKVKFEVDINPAKGFDVENKWIDYLEFAPVIVLDEASLFAGKLHAILCRNFKNQIKGRDYYDFLFYVSKNIKPNLNYLRNKLIESNKIKKEDEFNIDVLKRMLKERFESIDFKQVEEDARRFINKEEDLSYYSKDLFIQMIEKI